MFKFTNMGSRSALGLAWVAGTYHIYDLRKGTCYADRQDF